MKRQPAVAGQFYDANPEKVYPMIDQFLGLADKKREKQTRLAMVPHAGYVFSGGVCGKTLGTASLASTILLLGPNHTGMGDRFSLWPTGEWSVPGGSLSINVELAGALLAADTRITPDTAAHVREHSIEVILPFLYRLQPETTIVPIAISAPAFEDLQSVGESIANALVDFEKPVSIVVSSDMSHMVSEKEAERLDSMALEAAVGLDPHALYSTVRQHGITMCGVLPMTVGLSVAARLGASNAELMAYATSGAVTGDYDQVVGYAGMLVD